MVSNIQANVVFNNEAVILKHLVPIWNTYEIDEWVFYNDRSTDDSVDLLNQLDAKVTILNDNLEGPFNETYCRDRMLEYSRDSGAEFVIAIDADEFLSVNFAEQLRPSLEEIFTKYEVASYWYNFVNDINHIRQDPMYVENYKSFIMHVPSTGSFKQYQQMNIHCARTAPSKLPKVMSKEIGLMHLQAMNLEFYALKQLWYKHWEHKDLNQQAYHLNNKYDPVVNNLNLNPTKIDDELIKGISINANIFDELLLMKDYKGYILKNLVPELITFGKEYLYEN
jgi:glycosyltransferase involved in cell wall biosynthesis|tara:strand:- start:530 stop:1372 length:843 start_codon:yes stop_codon:yes gene_type:complete